MRFLWASDPGCRSRVLRHPRTIPAAGLRTVLVFGLVIALAGFFTGRSITAVRARAGLTQGYWLAARWCRTGWLPYWSGWCLGLHIQEGVVDRCDCDSSAGAGLLDQPTGKVILGITLGVLVALVIIEFLGRPPSPATPDLSEPETPEVPGPSSLAGVDLDDASPTASVAGLELTNATEANVRSSIGVEPLRGTRRRRHP